MPAIWGRGTFPEKAQARRLPLERFAPLPPTRGKSVLCECALQRRSRWAKGERSLVDVHGPELGAAGQGRYTALPGLSRLLSSKAALIAAKALISSVENWAHIWLDLFTPDAVLAGDCAADRHGQRAPGSRRSGSRPAPSSPGAYGRQKIRGMQVAVAGIGTHWPPAGRGPSKDRRSLPAHRAGVGGEWCRRCNSSPARCSPMAGNAPLRPAQNSRCCSAWSRARRTLGSAHGTADLGDALQFGGHVGRRATSSSPYSKMAWASAG